VSAILSSLAYLASVQQDGLIATTLPLSIFASICAFSCNGCGQNNSTNASY
jgi:hypothetical protein